MYSGKVKILLFSSPIFFVNRSIYKNVTKNSGDGNYPGSPKVEGKPPLLVQL